jgi:hypothetical protein
MADRVDFLAAGLSSIADFVADDAADGSAAHGSDRAAAGQDGTADGTDARTDRGALVLCRHAGAAPKAKQQDCSHRAGCKLMQGFHWIASFFDNGFPARVRRPIANHWPNFTFASSLH